MLHFEIKDFNYRYKDDFYIISAKKEQHYLLSIQKMPEIKRYEQQLIYEELVNENQRYTNFGETEALVKKLNEKLEKGNVIINCFNNYCEIKFDEIVLSEKDEFKIRLSNLSNGIHNITYVNKYFFDELE